MQQSQQNVFWLHGALHLHEDLVAGAELVTEKDEWLPGVALIDQVRDAILSDRLPLMITEGTWRQKQRRINSSAYLSHSQARLRDADGSLLTFGWALNANDEHIVSAIERSGLRRLCVGLHGEISSARNSRTIGAAQEIAARTAGRLKVQYWDTSTATVWT